MTDDASVPYGRQRQVEIFSLGKAGQQPDFPISHDELRAAAREALDADAWAYLAGGAGDETTMTENRRAFERWRIRPRMLRDVATRDLSVEVLDQELPVPVMLAPVGVQSLWDEDGELATARAASRLDVPMAVSTVSTEPMEAIADELGETTGWFQLYWNADEDVAASLVERAGAAGYEALVVTVDTPMTGWRERELRQASLPFFDGEGMGNYLTDDAFADSVAFDPTENVDAAATHLLETFDDASRTWSDLEPLAERTDLPVLVKGILHPADARAALNHGAEGVVVSNHGGRQVDGSIGALDALPGVVNAVGDEGAVLFDSGVRGGADAFRAVALGADAVCVGRPFCYGLAAGGADGVEAVLRNLLAELDLTVALSGYDAVADVGRDALVHETDLPP